MIAGVLLAAGAGTRFGGPKQLAELDGRPLIEHALSALVAAPGIDRAVVVLGARADEVRAGADLSAAQVVVAADWAEGQAASLRAGVRAVAPWAHAAVLMLGDQPRITSAVVARFAALAAEHGEHARARAVYDGEPGHPVVLGRAYFARLEELTGDVGARGVLRAIGADEIDCGELCSAADVDTPEQLEAMRT
jgi:CTP:molybdopterin cytidylyltransferase MocA